MTLADFETLVMSQRPASVPWTPVTPFDFESRKAIEGQHPQLILDVFTPSSIIDAGCGPGHLVRLLREAQPEIRVLGIDKAHGGAASDLANPDLWPGRGGFPGATLVICREVLEHLTVCEIRIAVTNLCRMSQRFVYVTTRFHPHPSDLLDVATSDDLDPTHISMCNKDFLRMLFVLEGFRCRPDLESKMDWQNKGRVLIYERT